MEKPRTKKVKTIQMKYPAPYSQSWPNPVTEKTDKPKKKKAKKNSSLLQSSLFPGCCHRTIPKPLQGSDPYAPHLKYGIFPQKAAKTRSVVETENANPSARNTSDHEVALDHADDKGENKKLRKAKVSDTPLFVIRPIDKRHRRQLSMSETLHLDIKPRKSLLRSPLRKSSPLFKNVIPKMNSLIE